MPEETPSLHIDTDWKKQAQEEKRRLAEQQKQAAPTIGRCAGRHPNRWCGCRRRRSPTRELPPASFATLVQSIVTQALFYLGDLAPRGGEPVVNLDMAKHHIDTLGVLETRPPTTCRRKKRECWTRRCTRRECAMSAWHRNSLTELPVISCLLPVPSANAHWPLELTTGN